MENIDTSSAGDVLVYASRELGYDWNTILDKMTKENVMDWSWGIDRRNISLYEDKVYYADDENSFVEDSDCIKVLKGYMEKHGVDEFVLTMN